MSFLRLYKQNNFYSNLGVLRVAHAQIGSKKYSTENPYNLASLKRGTGGRSSFNGIVCTVFGASGFVGRYVCNKLGKMGSQVIIPYRGDYYDVMRLKLVGDLGQVLFQPYYLRNTVDLDKAVKYSNVVVNLVGRDWETRNFKFNDVHCTGARDIAKACRKAGVGRLIHLSSLNAEEKPKGLILSKGSQFLASKWKGEQVVREEFPMATIFRPSDIYGQEDRFLKYYAHTWRRQGMWMPLWKKGEATVKQPVFVSDVAKGIINAIKDPDSAGKTYQAIGPQRYLVSELVDWFHRIMRRDKEWGYWRYDMRKDPLFKLKVAITHAVSLSFPAANLHWERIERECITDKVTSSLPTLEDLGVELTCMEDQVPWELKPHITALYHDRYLEDFGVNPEPPKKAV